MMKMSKYFFFFSLLPFQIHAVNPQARDIRIINEAGFKVEIFWINRWKNDELVLNSEDGIFHGAESNINSYITHEFEVHEVPNKKLGKCKGPDDTCRKGYFQVNENDEQCKTYFMISKGTCELSSQIFLILPEVVVLKEGLSEIVHTDNVSKAREQAQSVLQECKANAMRNFDSADPKVSMNELLKCIDTSVESAIKAKKNEIDFQKNLRFEMGSKLGAYSCVDPNVTMSSSIENKTWTNEGKKLNVQVFFDRPASKITYIQDFITQEECHEIESAVSFEDSNGVNGLFARKGGIEIPFHQRTSKITSLAHRMYAYAADLMRIQLQTENSEQIFMLHYPGNLENPSRYEPHCDGACDGSQHKEGERVATMIAYCETPVKGGHTHFNNAGIHIIPEKFSAVFLGYFDPVSNEQDTGFTRHTGCGVVEGEKKIVTHKIRI
jgi:hypothetical protein